MNRLSCVLLVCAVLIVPDATCGQDTDKSDPGLSTSAAPSALSMTLEEMLAVALQHNPDVRAAAAKVRSAEAELDRTRLTVVQNLIAFRQKWQAQRGLVLAAEIEQKHIERIRKLYKQGAVSEAEFRKVLLAEEQHRVEQAKMKELEAELPFLLGQAQGQGVTGRQPAKRLISRMLTAAAQVADLKKRAFEQGQTTQDEVQLWMRRVADLQVEAARTDDERRRVIEQYYAQLKALTKASEEKVKAGVAPATDLAAAQFHLLAAEAWMESVKNITPSAGSKPKPARRR